MADTSHDELIDKLIETVDAEDPPPTPPTTTELQEKARRAAESS